MSAPRARVRILALISVGSVFLSGGISAKAQERGGRPAPARADGAALRRFIVGERDCTRCHGHAENYTDQERSTMLCRMTESLEWNGRDKHKNACKVLLDSRGQAIGERLGIKAAESAACLNCHAISTEGIAGTDAFEQKTEGVGCVACHGSYREWFKDHQLPNDPEWRHLTRKEKQDRFGMTDLWNPVTRARTCANCHIGSAAEGKIVTHAMYAAGHPPLPGFEAATFSDSQPRHWQYLREKVTKPRLVEDLRFNPQKREQTELVVVGGVVALGQTMRLFAGQARDDGVLKEPETHWPDFARFDCSACHHDLQVPSWRQARGYDGVPGRPPAPIWPAVLVRLGVIVADPDGSKGRSKQLDQAIDAFVKALGRQPFGAGQNAALAAQSLADWAEAVGRDLESATEDPSRVLVDRALALRLLQELCTMSESTMLDYDSARQIAWAFNAIYGESKAIDPGSWSDPAIAGILGELDRQFTIALPSSGVQEPIEKTLGLRLRAVADFDPVTFRSQFARLAGHLTAPRIGSRLDAVSGAGPTSPKPTEAMGRDNGTSRPGDRR